MIHKTHSTTGNMLYVSHLFVYPVKSLAGIAQQQAMLEARGLAHDRRWVITDMEGKFITQRTHPRMALIHAALLGTQGLRLHAPGMAELYLAAAMPVYPTRHISIWDDVCEGAWVSGEADMWLSQFLGIACSLYYMPDTTLRPVEPAYAPPGSITGFSDAYPLLVITQASLDYLNAQLPEAIPMNRFRPNIVVAGDTSPHAEDHWRRLRIGAVEIELVKPCARCAVPNINQATAEQGRQPTATLARYRRWNNKIYFGQNALPLSHGLITVGDTVEILSEQVSPLQ